MEPLSLRLSEGYLRVDFVEVMAAQWGDRDDTWELVRRLAEVGSAGALEAIVVKRGRRNDSWDLVNRLAEEGSPAALEILVERRGDDDRTWELVTRLARAGAADALQALLRRRDLRTWEVVIGLDDAALSRLASKPGSSLSLQWDATYWEPVYEPNVVYALAAQWVHEDEIWQLVERLGEKNCPAAAPLLAWRTWARVSAGPQAAAADGGT
jgi:hypothetical protein